MEEFSTQGQQPLPEFTIKDIFDLLSSEKGINFLIQRIEDEEISLSEANYILNCCQCITCIPESLKYILVDRLIEFKTFLELYSVN
ncbi:MAG: hypothetical protein ABI721_01455 [Candidatus Dojkabacteria bacterium]